MKQFHLRWIIVAFIVILLSAWFYFISSVPNSANLESVQQVPKTGEIATDQLSSESSFNINAEASAQVSSIKDPFKQFLDKKGKSQPSTTENTKPNYPPGFDPFKAKLEEQRKEPYSAVSPFGK